MSVEQDSSAGDEPAFFLHRIAGNGDDGLVSAFRSWMPILNDYAHEFPSAEAFCEASPDHIRLGALCWIVGFWDCDGARPAERFPNFFQSDKGYWMTFLRDPIDIATACYAQHYDACTEQSKAIFPAFPDFIRNRWKGLAWLLGIDAEDIAAGLSRYALIVDGTRLEMAISSARQCLTDFLSHQKSSPNLRRLQARLEMPLPVIGEEFPSETRRRVEEGLTERDRDAMREAHPVDFLIWERLRNAGGVLRRSRPVL